MGKATENAAETATGSCKKKLVAAPGAGLWPGSSPSPMPDACYQIKICAQLWPTHLGPAMLCDAIRFDAMLVLLINI